MADEAQESVTLILPIDRIRHERGADTPLGLLWFGDRHDDEDEPIILLRLDQDTFTELGRPTSITITMTPTREESNA